MVSFTLLPFYPPESDSAPVPIGYGRSGCGSEEKKNPCYCRESNPGRPARSLVTIVTDACVVVWISFSALV